MQEPATTTRTETVKLRGGTREQKGEGLKFREGGDEIKTDNCAKLRTHDKDERECHDDIDENN
jgi:hypothetical protein